MRSAQSSFPFWLAPRGWLYNVSGSSAVELLLDDGRYVLIGTDEPPELESVLRHVVPPSDGGHALPDLPVPGLSGMFALLGIVLGGSAFVVGWLFYTGFQPPAVGVSATSFSVRGGVYGADVPFASIQELYLQDTIPRSMRRRNGFAAGNTLRGSFTLDVLGDGRIFITRGRPPYIVVKTTDSFLIVNFEDPQQTRALYEKLRQHVGVRES